MRIITISREFGSGGRELGKRLSDRMGYAYYDREIITAIAQKSEMDEGYVEKVVESRRYHNIPLTFGRTFSFSSSMNQNTTKLLVTQHKVMKELAEKGDCIIVGRGANILLQGYHLCLNTGGLEIKELEPVIFEYARFWFGRNEG